MSVTEIYYKKEKKTLEVSHRIFGDDLEKAIEKKFNKKFDLSLKGTSEENLFIERYLTESFKIFSNGTLLNADFIGKEIDKDAIMVYMEIDSIPNVKSIKCTNQILFEIFKDQSNLIHFHNGKHLESKKVTIRNPETVFAF